MILRPAARPQTLLQAVKKPCLTCIRPLTPCISRSNSTSAVHSVPPLSDNKDAIFSQHGVPGFLSAHTYNQTWLTYQSELCKYLDTHTRGTPFERMNPRELHESLSRQPQHLHLYNHAAAAHHNHFFWNLLSAEPVPNPPSPSILANIEEWFEGSLDRLRDEMLDTAMSMFGQGYVWLMKKADTTAHAPDLHVLATYNAGSPFPRAHIMRQNMGTAADRLSRPLNTAGHFGNSSGASSSLYAQHSLKSLPILCLKVFEHQWLYDYGINGKEWYVRTWWDRIDWDEVASLSTQVSPDQVNWGPGATRNPPSPPRPTPTMSKAGSDLMRSINQSVSDATREGTSY